MQIHINNYVQHIKLTKKNWINTHQLYTPTKKGEMGMIRLNEFLQSIKVSWIKRYCIRKVDDHWADNIDTHFKLTKNTRTNLLDYGPKYQ